MYMKDDSKQVWVAKQRAELEVFLGWIGAVRNLDSEKKDEEWISGSEGL